MKNRILKLVTEPIFIDTFFIILGFILLRNIKVSEVNFTNTTNILLAIGVVFMVMHFDNLKEIVKKKTLSKEDIKDYHDFLFELILILLIAYLFFLVSAICSILNRTRYYLVLRINTAFSKKAQHMIHQTFIIIIFFLVFVQNYVYSDAYTYDF